MADEKKKDAADAAAADTKADKPKSDGGGAGAGGGNKFMLIGVIAAILVINSAIAYVLVQMTSPKKEVAADAKHGKDSTAAESTEHTTSVGATTGEKPIEAIVNIAGTDGERFLKVSVAFEYDDVTYPLLGEALESRSPKIKDMLIDHLSKLTLVEVTEPDAKDRIRKDMLRLVNNSLPKEDGSIRDVYILNYIIQ